MSSGLKNGHHATKGIMFYVNSACVLNSRLLCIRNPLRIRARNYNALLELRKI